MRKVLLLSIVALFIMSGDAYPGTKIMEGIDVYTFKRKRVDQELSGNRGYLSGKPSYVPSKKKSEKRTLIGVDVEVPSVLLFGRGGGKKTSKKTEKTVIVEKKPVVIVEEVDIVSEDIAVSEDPYSETQETTEETEEIVEEEWIK